MGIFNKYSCTICKREFQYKDIRYSHDGKKIVCISCYSQLKDDAPKKTEIKIETPALPETVRIICRDCRYKFSLKKAPRTNVICPYCGGNNLMKDEITADKLLEEASQGY